MEYRIEKIIKTVWYRVEADSIMKAVLKARKLQPDKQVVLESHGKRVKL